MASAIYKPLLTVNLPPANICRFLKDIWQEKKALPNGNAFKIYKIF